MAATDWISTGISCVALILSGSTAWSVYRKQSASYVIGAPPEELRTVLRRIFERSGAVQSAVSTYDDISRASLPNVIADLGSHGQRLIRLVELSEDVPIRQHATKVLAGIKLIEVTEDPSSIGSTAQKVREQASLALRRLDHLEHRPRLSGRPKSEPDWNP